MQLIAEQLRNGQIQLEEAARRAADKVHDANLPALEYVLRCVEGAFAGTGKPRQESQAPASSAPAVNVHAILS